MTAPRWQAPIMFCESGTILTTSLRTLNDPRLQGEGFKRGRFEIDHRPRPPDLLLVMVPETTGMRCFGAQTGQTLKAQRATAAAVSPHDATSPILRFA